MAKELPGTGFTPSLGVVIDGKTYAWLSRVDEQSIAKRRAHESASRVVSAAAFGIAILLVVVTFVVAFTSEGSQLFKWSYWFVPSGIGLLTSLTGIAISFAFYRFVSLEKVKAKLPIPEEGAKHPESVPLPTGSRKNVADYFTTDANKTVEAAFALAKEHGHREVHPIHLFVSSLSLGDVALVFGRLGIKFEAMKDPLVRRIAMQQVGAPTRFSKETEEVVLSAFGNTYIQERKAVSSVELMFEAFRRDEFLQELLLELEVDQDRLANVVEWIRISGVLRERYDRFRKAAKFKPTGSVNRAYTSRPTPNLDAISEDLTAQAVAGRLPLLIGREKEIRSILRVIESGGNGALLVGSPGVGKSAVLAGLAERMVEERVPKVLQDKRLVNISIPQLISGASPSEAQERLLRVLSEAVQAGNVVLVIQNLEQITGVSPGGAETADVAALLSDVLSKGIIPVIATTTPDAYAKAIERSLLGQVFQKIEIPEPDVSTAIRVLESKMGEIEYETGVVFSFDAVERAVKLSDRYMHETYLPKKAIEICREAAQAVVTERGKDALVSGEDVAIIVSEKTNIPVTKVGTEEKETLLDLEERMHGRVIGQDEAVIAVSKALRRARAELRSENRPIATFLFLGPTGVGKTELAKTVAEAYFGNEKSMVRLDMSEYQDTGSIARLIGVPGSEQGGQLTEAVRRNPFSIVLLDEFEKAHPDILNVFLQVFDDGRLTDSAGRTIDFTNTILIATSNAGTPYIQDAVAKGETIERMKTVLIEEELKGIYRPELLNRFDGIIVFKPLTQEEVVQIAGLMIKKVASRLEPKGIGFRASEEAIREIAHKGYDPKFGARPLRRVIQEEVDSAIAEVLLKGSVGRRDTIVLNPGGNIDIEKAAPL